MTRVLPQHCSFYKPFLIFLYSIHCRLNCILAVLLSRRIYDNCVRFIFTFFFLCPTSATTNTWRWFRLILSRRPSPLRHINELTIFNTLSTEPIPVTYQRVTQPHWINKVHRIIPHITIQIQTLWIRHIRRPQPQRIRLQKPPLHARVHPRIRVFQLCRHIPLISRELVTVQKCLTALCPLENHLSVRIVLSPIDHIPIRVRQLPRAPQMIRVHPVKSSIITLLGQQLPAWTITICPAHRSRSPLHLCDRLS